MATSAAPEVTLPWLMGFPLREAFDHTSIGVLAVDGGGLIRLMSPALCELFGPQSEEIRDATGPACGPLHVDGSPMHHEETPLGRAMRGEFVKDEVVGAYDVAGRLLWLSANAVPFFDESGVPDGGVVLLQDVTAERTAELAEAALRARLAHAVNHEFRTPLTALLGNLEVVRDHLDVSPEIEQALATLEHAAWQLCHLVGTVAELVERHESTAGQ